MSISAKKLLNVAIASTALVSTGIAHAASKSVPMAGDPPHPWFDWIFFGIVIPWLLLAIWDYARTGSGKR